mgnify:CR=1 FL=1
MRELTQANLKMLDTKVMEKAAAAEKDNEPSNANHNWSDGQASTFRVQVRERTNSGRTLLEHEGQKVREEREARQ